MFINNIKMKPKLTALFLIVGIIPLILVGWWSSRVATDSLMDKSYGQLKSVREIKKAQIEKIFAEREGDMRVLVETVGTLRQEAFNKLTAVREVKRAAIERYFQSINDQMLTFSEDRMVIDAMKQFRDSFRTFRAETMGGAEGSDRMRSEALTDRSGIIAGTEKLDRMRSELLTYYTGEFTTEYRNRNANRSPDAESFFRQLDDDSIALQYHYIRANPNPLGSKHILDQADDTSRYSKFHGTYHPIIRNYLEKFGYYDIFLVDLETGDIVYSVFKELDYSTSLIDGPYAQTNFGEAFRMAKDATDKDAVFLVDYAKYTPSYEAPASFIASPIFDGDEKIGVALFQMPIDRLNTIMNERAGLGETGETYLVGPDLLMRSDSYLDPKHHSVIASFKDPARGKVDTEASHAALEGKIETKVTIDYNGNPVLSSYTPVKIGNFTWGLLSEIDVVEAFSPVDTEGHEFYAAYKDLYGYDDLFLINPDGYIFYTVEKEPDYQTNILTGTYKDSNLGELVRRVLGTKRFDIEDFKPYTPCNNAPAAFIAQPLVHNGEVELVIALQLPLEAVNSIMQQREGMGESGETYLVGSDNLMRSDSYLDPENHSVAASFANPKKGRVETAASMEAFAGKTGEQIVMNYNGNPVLSAFTPLQVGGITWALLAEIDEAEVKRPINTLIFSILIAGAIISAGVAVLAVAVATGIANPLTKGVEFARAIAAGDLSADLAILQKDEVGILAGAMREMKARIRDVLQEMNGLIHAIQDGKLDTRGNAEVFTGGWREVIVGINNVIDAFMSPFNVAAEYIDRIANGDLPQTITSEYKGDFNELKNNLNGLIHNLRTLTDTAHAIANGDMTVQIEKRSEHDELVMAFQHMIGTITSLINEMNMLVEAAVEGRLDTRGDPRKFSGDYAGIVKGVNDTLDAVIGPLNVAAEYVDRISKGDIPEKITDEYRGDFNEIKNNLNQCIDVVDNLVADTKRLTEAAVEGQLDIRGDIGKFSGGYATIVNGINNTIETLVGHINQIPATVMIIDTDFNIRYINTTGADLLNVPQEHLIGEKCYNHFKTSDCHTAKCACGKAINSGKRETSKTDAHPAGKDVFIAYHAVPIKDRSDKIIGALEIVTDQTEIMKVMDDTRTKVEYLNNIPTPVVVIDKDFSVQFINPAGAATVGRKAEDCLGQKCFNLFHTPHCRTADCQLAKAMQQDGIFTSDTIAKLPSDELPIRYTGAPLKDENGHIVGALEYVLDISKEMEITTEVLNLAAAAVEGKLDTRANVEKFEGNYRRIVQGVNDTLDALIEPLNVAAEYVAQISNGDIPNVITAEYQGDFNDIKNNLNRLISSTNEVTTLAQEIAGGNLKVNVTLRSEHDHLMQALEHMIGYLQEVADVTEKISNKNLQVVVQPKSEQDVLNHSLQKMVTTLQTMIEELERSMIEVRRQNWLRTGQAELGNTMRGEQESPTLAKNIVAYLTTYLQAQVGTIYLLDKENSSLQLTGSYAYTDRKGNRNNLKLGEGLVGQAALEKEGILFTNVPGDYLTISSSLGETAPRSILVSPFMYEGEVKGVIELGTIKKFTRIQRTFLNQVSENIAIAFNSTQTRKRMQELLEATQQQAKELQTQQESLRVTNEELEAQTDALRESEKKLQIQQEELRQTNEELEEQAKALEQQQRTLQDKNLDLENAQHLVEKKAKELELSSKYKSEFLANMSHELRTPLNSLLILSKLLSENKEGNLTEKQVEFSQTIYSAGSDLLELINEVLDLSKIEAGKMVLNIEEMSLKGLSNYIEQHFAHMAEEKGLTLKITLAKNVPASIHTDRQRVEQIVKNLLSNAIKFTSKGGITIDITRPANTVDLSRSGLNPQHAVAISVTDTGTGISEEKQDLIFEAFQQADGTTSRKYGGTGLGLSITRELTKLLGGEMQLRSKAGKGSTFTLYLPEKIDTKSQVIASLSEAVREVSGIHAFAEAETPPGVEAIWDDRHDTTSPADKLLLIVEDDPKFAKILFDLARTKEFKCLVAGDGAAGLQLAYQYKPGAIILDVGLPGMDGWAVMKKLKHNPETRHIPVHFISSQEASLDAMKMGAIGYLTKPVTLEMLDEVFKNIETAISRSVKKLLIVEDDDTMRKSMLELLGGEDVAITTAKTGQEAYRLLKSEIFDCMVLDLGLADISGFKLLEQIKADAATSYLPIIVYTGKDLTKKEETRLKKHAESIILKGVNSEERLLDEAMLFLHRVEADLPETQQKKLRLIHDKEKVLSGKTILMADDDMRNVFALSSVLEEKGLHVLIAENGKEALDLLTQHAEINLVLIDIMMPEMDGYEVMKRIRKQPKFRKLPIIALTAKAMKGDRQRCIEAGANDYLSKPVDIDKLLSLLRVWLY